MWTLRYRGPDVGSAWARRSRVQYQLSWPMAMGSVPPLLRFQPAGASAAVPRESRDLLCAPRLATPLELTRLADRRRRPREGADPGQARRSTRSMNVDVVQAHRVQRRPRSSSARRNSRSRMPQGKATTTATFNEPGEYVIRVRGDSFGNIDSTPGRSVLLDERLLESCGDAIAVDD